MLHWKQNADFQVEGILSGERLSVYAGVQDGNAVLPRFVHPVWPGEQIMLVRDRLLRVTLWMDFWVLMTTTLTLRDAEWGERQFENFDTVDLVIAAGVCQQWPIQDIAKTLATNGAEGRLCCCLGCVQAFGCGL